MSKEETKQNSIPENEIRVSGKTNVLKTISRIEEVFKTHDNVTISGINTGISKVLLITEIAKLKIKNLHQYNKIETITGEMKEQDQADEAQPVHYLTRFKVELSKTKIETPKNTFYQVPYSEEQIKKISEIKAPEKKEDFRPRTAPRGFRGRGRGRGMPRGEGRGRGRGIPRGEGRGRGRGMPRGEGRGRGRGRGMPRGEGRGRPGTNKGNGKAEKKIVGQ